MDCRPKGQEGRPHLDVARRIPDRGAEMGCGRRPSAGLYEYSGGSLGSTQETERLHSKRTGPACCQSRQSIEMGCDSDRSGLAWGTVCAGSNARTMGHYALLVATVFLAC